MTPPPPRSTLFPYTTLFRSRHHSLITSAEQLQHCRELLSVVREEYEDIVKNEVQRAIAADEEDRKSTRLNSSHRCISYAVFCLKKKNQAIKKLHSTKHSSTV